MSAVHPQPQLSLKNDIQPTLVAPVTGGGSAEKQQKMSIKQSERPTSPTRETHSSIKPVVPLTPAELRGKKVLDFLALKQVDLFLTALTLYLLFGEDIKILCFSISADPFFAALSLISFVLFSIEFVLNSIYKPRFAWTFYFWLDFVSTISIIPDIDWFWNAAVGTTSSSTSVTAKKATSVAQTSSKAGRIVRIVRLVRIIRVVKLYKMKTKAQAVDLQEKQELEPSQIGKILTELISRRLVILVLTVIVFVPLIDGSILQDNFAPQTLPLYNLHRMPQDLNSTATPISESYFRFKLEEYLRSLDYPFLSVRVCPDSCATSWPSTVTDQWLSELTFQHLSSGSTTTINDSTAFDLTTNPITQWTYQMVQTFTSSPANFRTEDTYVCAVSGCYNASGQCTDCDADISNCYSQIVLDISSQNKSEAVLSITKSLSIIVVMAAGLFMFTRDAQTLVIGPIERMISLVKKLAENPLASLNKKSGDEAEKSANDMETYLLEVTLAKIGALLQVSFGAAGTEIIGKNLSSQGDLNVMLPGKKISSIFCFGIIEDFTNSCSDLEEEIISYINTVAEIIHYNAHDYFGAANKNIGSAFLLAWKMCDGTLPLLRDPRDTEKPERTDAILKEKRKGIHMKLTGAGTKERKIEPTEFFDNALVAVLKMMIDVHNINLVRPGGPKFDVFLNGPKVAKKFASGFEVHMGFGLHVGWAIEGAIGSKYKIDASYLSPNVNMAARLEAATGQFHTHLLISEWFYDELSEGAKKRCRMVDRVCVKGSAIPMCMWTFDICNFVHGAFKPIVDADGLQHPVDFANDPQFDKVQEGIPPQFFACWKNGLSNYLGGTWPEAKLAFQEALSHYDDGPSHVLLHVMEEFNFVAPSSWQGFRELTEK